MTTDELRAAASSVLAYGSDREWADIESAMVVANAYLAEHPADDAEPVTGEWLRDAGGEYDAETESYVFTDETLSPLLSLKWQLDCWSAELGHGDIWYGNWPHDLYHRAHVRRLCAALGIPLKEMT